MKKNKNEKTEKKKKTRLKWQFKLIIFLIFIVFYMFFVGTKGIFIKEFNIKTNKIDDKMGSLKILQFSDLHYGSSINKISNIDNLVKKINSTKPDIVIFTGDLIKNEFNLENSEKENLIKSLSKINAQLGKFYINGEDDNNTSESILNLSGFINLENGAQIIYKNSTRPILLIDEKNSETYFDNNNTIPEFKILALHNPDDFSKFTKVNFDLAVAGHTHNGQINIPKVKDLFIKSKFKSTYQKVNNTELFVNPGLGTNKINARLFNHPTIYLYRINKI